MATDSIPDIIHSFPYVLFAWLEIIDRLQLWYTRCRRFPSLTYALTAETATRHGFYWTVYEKGVRDCALPFSPRDVAYLSFWRLLI
jgi:hypothetical protein